MSRPKQKVSLSIIIPTRNRATLLKNCLQHLVGQVDQRDEVLVVDNNSQDNTRQVVLSFQKKMPIRYLFEPRKGASFARNSGISKAEGKILGFLDDDMVPNQNWVREVKKLILMEDFIYAGKVENIYPQKDIFSQTARFREKLFWPLILKESSSRSKFRPVINFLDSGNFCLRQEITLKFKRVFDEKNFPFIGEQQDLAERLQLAGYKIIYNPRMLARQQKSKLMLKKILLESFLWGRAIRRIEKKYQASSKLTELFPKYKKPLSLAQKLKIAWGKTNLLIFFLFFLWEATFSLGKVWERFHSSVFKRI